MSASKEIKEFIHAADQLVKYSAGIKELPDTKHTVATVSARREELKDLWAYVKIKYTECCLIGNESEEFDPKTFEAKYKLCNETYIECLGFLFEVMTQLTKSTESALPSPTIVNQSAPSFSNHSTNDPSNSELNDYCIKLPACETELFHGDYLSWPAFRDMFQAIYINHSKLSPVEQLFHLRAKTRGDAFNLVNKFPLTNSSFALAWDSLRSTYENKRIIVNNQIKKLLHLPSCANEAATEIKRIQNHINDSIAALKSHGISVDTWDPILVFSCCSRLPASTLSLWEQSLVDHSKVPKWEHLDKFLSTRFQILETIADAAKPSPEMLSSRLRSNKINFSNNRVNTLQSKAQPLICKLCANNHLLRSCKKFLNMALPSKIEFVQNRQICFNCLSADHLVSACPSRFSCNTCGKRHHTLLHRNNERTSAALRQRNLSVMSSVPSSSSLRSPVSDSANNNREYSTNIQSTSSPAIHQSHFVSTHKKVLLATALITIICKESKHTVRALIDPGSEVSIISESTQKRLNLPVSPINVAISSVSAAQAATSSKLCAFTIFNKESPTAPIFVQAIVLRKVTNDLPSTSLSVIDPHHLNGLCLADPLFAKSAKIDLLIGADIYPSIVREGLQIVHDSLVAQNTVFGWILSGPISQSFKTFCTFVEDSADRTLDHQIKRFWELEEVGEEKKILSTEERYCEDFYKRITVRRSDGRYVVRLPFKSLVSSQQLGFSRDKACKQFLRTEKTLIRNPGLQSDYCNVINEYLQLGHLKKVKSLEIVNNSEILSFYMPHHAVIKPESSSTRVRMVFNASSASTSGASLNDLLYAGPVLQRDLTSLIVRWRFYKFVFNADIEKMYRQIVVHANDTPFQRIVFRFSADGPIEDCELLTVTFGVNCAPYLAIRTLLKLADDYEDKFPLASKIVRSEFYVDDVLSGAHDLQTAKRSQLELIALLKSGGFPLRSTR